MNESQLRARLQRAEELLREQEQAESCYRHCHDTSGGSSIATGRAWDRLRRSGDAARAFLAHPDPKGASPEGEREKATIQDVVEICVGLRHSVPRFADGIDTLQALAVEALTEPAVPSAGAREDECAHELHRLARELGLPDDGPQENVNGAIALARSAVAQQKPAVSDTVWATLHKIEQDAPSPFSQFACTVRYELERALTERAVGVPEGWKLVPEIATLEMADAAEKALDTANEHRRTLAKTALIAYEAMLAAAPQPPEQENIDE